jgi:hypothetical protein
MAVAAVLPQYGGGLPPIGRRVTGWWGGAGLSGGGAPDRPLISAADADRLAGVAAGLRPVFTGAPDAIDDVTRNASRRFCGLACQNRAKATAYRARRRT